MLTTILPAPWRWAILVTLFAMAAGFGWLEGASHVQARWDAAQAKQADTVARQAVRAATITAAQTHATEEVANNVENRIAASTRWHRVDIARAVSFPSRTRRRTVLTLTPPSFWAASA